MKLVLFTWFLRSPLLKNTFDHAPMNWYIIKRFRFVPGMSGMAGTPTTSGSLVTSAKTAE
jgi:hypothetical protein